MAHILATLPKTKFPLGQTVVTTQALETLNPDEITRALKRHEAGDWGDLCRDDRSSNDRALEHGGRLFSAYGDGVRRLWIITECDRSVTTVLLQQDY